MIEARTQKGTDAPNNGTEITKSTSDLKPNTLKKFSSDSAFDETNAFKAKVEASAYSASSFFGLPQIPIGEWFSTGVRIPGENLGKDTFCYNVEQLKDLKCTTFADLTKVWAHECGHRMLRNSLQSPWGQELGSDFFSGVLAEIRGLPKGNFEKSLSQTNASVSHPDGALRIKAIDYGRAVVRNMREQGITPCYDNCREAFLKSDFSKMTYEGSQNSTNVLQLSAKEGFLKGDMLESGRSRGISCFKKELKSEKLLPNMTYKVKGELATGHEYEMKTDSQGRVTDVNFKNTDPDEMRVNILNRSCEAFLGSAWEKAFQGNQAKVKRP